MSTLSILIEYTARILPGLTVLAAVFFVFRKSAPVRILLYVAFFVLVRDALTPLGLWSLGVEGFLWIRLHDDPLFVTLFGIASLIIMGGIILLDKENRRHIRFFAHSPVVGICFSLAGCVLVVLPLGIIYRFVDISFRGGAVASSLILPVFVFAIFGNFFEEGLFRGYVLGLLKEKYSPLMSGILSGLIFSACHVFLAVTVTDIGYPILVFALWEGVIAGVVGTRFGLIPATLTHGGAIFLLASGLV